MALTQAKIAGSRLPNKHVREVPKEPQKTEEKNKAFVNSYGQKDKSALGKMMSKDLDEQFNVFMKMFITQLQNQDPTEPMDGTQMTNNLLMFFTAAEQAKTNFHLEKLNHTNETEQLVAAKSYLNKEVTYEGNELTFDGQPQPITVDIPKGAQNTQVMIFDPATNKRLKTIDLGNQAGTKTVIWDGSQDGDGAEKVTAGQYLIKVQAEKDKNTWYDITPRMKGTVTAIDYLDDREFVYYVNQTPVRFENIQQVRKPTRDGSISELKESLQQQIHSIDNLKSLVEKNVHGQESTGLENSATSSFGEGLGERMEAVPEVVSEEALPTTPPSSSPPVEKGTLETVVDTITGLFK